MIPKFANLLFTFAMFLLPWQTQWVLGNAGIAGEPSSYGVFGVYVVEAMIVASFLLRGRVRAAPEIRSVTQPLYLFLAVAFFSLALSAWSQVGWFLMMHVVSAAALFLLLIDERTNLKRALVAFLAGLVIPVAIGWFQVVTGGSPDSTFLGMAGKQAQVSGVAVVQIGAERMLRAYGTFPHPNIFGGYIAIGMLILAWLTRFVSSRWQLVLAALASVILIAALVITFSRAAWIAFILAMLVGVVVARRERRLIPKRIIPVVVFGFVGLFTALFVFHAAVFARFDPSVRIEAISLEERTSQYQTFGRVFLSSPFFGVGPNAYTFALASQNPGFPIWVYQPIHNVFLLVLSELGMFGFVLFVFWIFRITSVVLAVIRTSNGTLALCLGVVLFVVALLDHYLWSLWSGLALSVLSFGVMVRLVRMSYDEANL